MSEIGGHLFAGSLTRKRKIFLRGTANTPKDAAQVLSHLLAGARDIGPVYYEIWRDGGEPRRRKS